MAGNRAGLFVKNLSGAMEYESFRPTPLPPIPAIAMDGEAVEYLVEANKQLAALDSIARRIPSVELFVSMYVRKEALLSSQIEGTQCTLEDVLNPIHAENANRDVADVINYIKATEFALERLREMPICARLIREIHGVLMQNVRGQEKNPGEFRRSQNWIGGAGSTLKTARYIPPNVADMEESISALERFMNEESELDPLICAALIHYQFETIHPFLDENGRIGRLLVILYLIEKKILSVPVLYISYFLKRNRIEYYDRMTEVRRTGNFEQWIKFFLQAIAEAASDGLQTVDTLLALHDKNTRVIQKYAKVSKSVEPLFAYLETNPIIEVRKTAEALNIAYNTAAKAVKLLEDGGVLRQTNKTGKTRIYSYEAYLEILRKDT